ncbi:MAG: hypothetical protein C3F02_03055 [Parcubacteria group bacterium]|nr:MAG: hypothetical protein C3F02_03055 [Parcubacteria group bacterium]
MIGKNKKGFSLIELLVAISFVAVIIVLTISISGHSFQLRRFNQERTQAIFDATEGIEAANLISWSNLSSGQYHPVVSGGTWNLASGSELLDGKYTRLLTVSDVYRASSTNGQVHGAIVATGGYLDPDTKKITVDITWPSAIGQEKSVALENFRYRWGATRWIQTDWSGGAGQNQWSDPTKFYTKDSGIDVSFAGTATLSAGHIDWTQATTTAYFDTPGNFDDTDVFEVNGIAYLVTENNPSGSEFYILDVSNIGSPVLISSLDIGDGVTSVVTQGNYAYLSTRGNNSEITVVDVSDRQNPHIIYTYNLPSNDDARDLVLNNSQVFVVQGANLYAFSLANPAAPLLLDSISVDDNAWELYLAENNVFIATQDSDKELQIIDATNPANLLPRGQYNLSGNLKATDVNVRGTRAYLATENNGSYPEFYVFDITDPSAPVLLGSYEVGESVHSFAIVGQYALLGTNFLDEELVVIDIANPAAITKISGFNLYGFVLGMSANCSVIYAATSGNQKEFFIIWTQVSNCGYSVAGTLESSTYDTGSNQTVYNWISWTGTMPDNTVMKFQLATSNDIGGPWNYAGPNGTAATYYTVGAHEYINYSQHVNQRYIRYKLFMSSTAELLAPVLEEVTISYSIN